MDILTVIKKVKRELDKNLLKALHEDISDIAYINSVNSITNKYLRKGIDSSLNKMFVRKFTKLYKSEIDKKVLNGSNFLASRLDNKNVVWFEDILKQLPFNSRQQYKQLVQYIELSMLDGDITRDVAVKLLKTSDINFKVRLANGRNWDFSKLMKRRLRDSIRENALTHAEYLAQELNTNVYQVSEHQGARPLCSQDQGKIFSDDARELVDFRGNIVQVESWSNSTYGQPAGLFGFNCRHMKYPYTEGFELPSKIEDDPLYSTDKHIDDTI